jgi:hypothetical protein
MVASALRATPAGTCPLSHPMARRTVPNGPWRYRSPGGRVHAVVGRDGSPRTACGRRVGLGWTSTQKRTECRLCLRILERGGW